MVLVHVGMKSERRTYLAFGRWILLAVLIIPLLLASCRKNSTVVAPQGQKEIVAQVGHAVIELSTLQEELNRRSRATPGRYATPEKREELLDELIREKVLLERAKTAGYERDPELVRRFEQMIVAKYEEDNKGDAAKSPAPSAIEIESYYHARKSEFSVAEKVRVALLHLKGSSHAVAEKKVELGQRAAALRAEAVQLPSGEPAFGDLARQHSDDLATRYKGGDCGWIERGRGMHSWPAPVLEAMFALAQPGELSPVVQANGSCYLVKLIERKDAGVRPLSEVRDLIVHRLAQQKKEQTRREFDERQRTGLHIEINRSALASVKVTEPAIAKTQAPPPALPSR